MVLMANERGRPVTISSEGTPFGAWLKKQRTRRGWSSERFAEEIGISQGSVSLYERGQREPRDRATILLIADALAGPDADEDEREALRREALAASVGIESQETTRPALNKADPLLSYGVEVNSAPYLYAMRNVQSVSAGLDMVRMPDGDAPGEDITHRWPVRAIRIVGDCMEPYLSHGDVALVLPPEAAEDGWIVTATVDIQYPVCKRVRITDKASWLEPVNGEGVLPEARFIITGAVADKITPLRPVKAEDAVKAEEKK